MITFPPLRTPDPNKPLPSRFKSNSYCHFHQESGGVYVFDG
jgi:hypothetical protein